MANIIFGGGSFMDTSVFNSFETVEKAINVLLANGVTTIDTARLYPQSEELIGNQEARTRFIIDTKIPGGSIPGTATRDGVLNDAEDSLRKVKITQFDILYIHTPDTSIPLEDTLAGINEAHKKGIFRRFGLSNYRPDEVEKVYNICKEQGYPLPEIYQGNYSPIARHAETILFPTLRRLGISFNAYSPLAGGFLTKTTADLNNGAGRFNPETYGGLYNSMYNKPAMRTALAIWNEIAEKEGVSRAELAYRWVAHHSILEGRKGDGVIFGASSLEQIEQTVQGLKKGPLSEQTAERINSLWSSVHKEAPTDIMAYGSGIKGPSETK